MKINIKKIQLALISGVITVLVFTVFLMSKDAFSNPKKGLDKQSENASLKQKKDPFTKYPIIVKTAALTMTGKKYSKDSPGDKISLPTDPKAKKKIKANPIEMTGVRGEIDIDKIKEFSELDLEDEEDMRDEEDDMRDAEDDTRDAEDDTMGPVRARPRERRR